MILGVPNFIRLRLYPLNLIPIMRAQGFPQSARHSSNILINTRGATYMAEIIPLIPDTGNAGEGKV